VARVEHDDGDHDCYPDEWKAMLVDLLERTKQAVSQLANLAADTGIQFTLEDVVDLVEWELPIGHVGLMPLEDVRPAFRDFIRRCGMDLQ